MEIERKGLAGSGFGVTSFVASSHPAESCGLNGLPLTPNSVAILGASQLLLTCRHPGLARYLDVQRGKRQRIVVVGEIWPDNLSMIDSSQLTEQKLLDISKEILLATAYLHQMNIVNMNISRENVMLDTLGNVKLFNYGLARMTNYGSWVSFPVGDPRLTAPEVFRHGRDWDVDEAAVPDPHGDFSITQIPEETGPPYPANIDTWSIGLLLASLALDIPVLWPEAKKPGQVVRKVLSISECETGAAVLERLSREHGCVGRVSTIPQTVLDLIQICLTPSHVDRPGPEKVLEEMITPSPLQSDYQFLPTHFPSLTLRCSSLPARPPKSETAATATDFLTTEEIYYLWQLAGGDVMSELRKHGLMVTTPPLLSLPLLTSGEGQTFGQPKQRYSLYDKTIITLPMGQLDSCLSHVPIEQLTPLVHKKQDEKIESRNLPLVIRERDVRYQCGRAILYRRLLQSYPHKKADIWQESLVDVVPIFRNKIWAALLNIPHNNTTLYNNIDKETWNPVDRQIEVDIPRCHQYNELLASPEGHRKLKRVLKAWVSDNPHLVYWQGLDSLAAPFIYLNFNDEALAWACLSAFIPKYLHNMFLKDNAAVIQEYLAKFSHLQAFHDPVMFNHLDEIGFIPDLYAIPWVLTMFSHVFPLHKIFHLWDRLLLGNSSFPLCVGLAVLTQLRSQLMEAQFNECILLFSDMPAVDIDHVVSTSMEIFCTTPPSLSWRQHDCVRTIPDKDTQGPSLEMEGLSVATLKNEKVGRISGADLIPLLVEDCKKAVVIDVRPTEDFKLGSLTGAMNLPPWTDNDELILPTGWDGTDALTEASNKGMVISVLGSTTSWNQARLVAEGLLKLKFPRVALVHGGVEVFRASGDLVVPNV